MGTKMLLIISWTVLCVASGLNSNSTCGTIVNCSCGTGENKTYVYRELKKSMIEDLATGELTCPGIFDASQECADISCVETSMNTEPEENGKHVMDYFYPRVFEIPPGQNPKANRVERQTECNIKELERANLKCWEWPEFIECEIKCTVGYGIRTAGDVVAESTRVNCRTTYNAENVWKPHEFRDCEPFVNCKVKLESPGELTCHEPLYEPAFCDISCENYELDAVDRDRYTCLDESFGRNLPPCAALWKNVKTLKKPK